jgi:hypothetical protein
MSPRALNAGSTFDTVRRRYDEWRDSAPPVHRRPVRSRPSGPTTGTNMSKRILTGIGVGTGFVLLVLAGLAFWASASWSGYGREGAATGYAVVGFFLTIAGIGGALATWYHNFRVLDPNRRPSHAHH